MTIFSFISLLFLSDILFTAYFNSFYQESATFIFLLFFVALFQSKRITFWWEWMMIMGLSFSKVSNVTFILLFLLLAIKYWHRPRRTAKIVVTIAMVCVIVGVQSANQSESDSPNIFNSFFQGLMRDQNAPMILKDFDLTDPLYVNFVGKDFWEVEQFQGHMKADFYAKVNHSKIIVYYLTHPGIVGEKSIKLVGQLITKPRPTNLGNRSKEFSQNFVLETRITSFWQALLPYILLPGLIWSFIQAWYLWYKRHVWQSEELLLIALPFFLPLQLLTSFIGDGWNEFAKHNVTFYFVFVIWFLLTWQFWYKHFEAKKV